MLSWSEKSGVGLIEQDIVFGNYHPTGRLPLQMPKDMETVERRCEDVAFDLEPYTDECGNQYDYGFGLNYSGKIG